MRTHNVNPSSDSTLENEIQADLRVARRVLYLEGKTDPSILWALLAPTAGAPRDSILDGVFVKGLSDKDYAGSGADAVRRRVALGANQPSGKVFGVLDGDGAAPLAEKCLTGSGPLFSWPVYCIENWLALAPWPTAWGEEPDWSTELLKFAPYAALNRLHKQLKQPLRSAGILGYINPDHSNLITAEQAKDNLRNIDGSAIERDFTAIYEQFVSAVSAIQNQAQMLSVCQWLNGKWLLNNFLQCANSTSQAQCRERWCVEVRALGGHPDVKTWWSRCIREPSSP